MPVTREQVLNIVSENDGLKAKEIARQLGVTRNEVNSILYRLRATGAVAIDSEYSWRAIRQQTTANGINDGNNTAPQVQKEVDEKLHNLCRYYLHCLSIDEGGKIETWARSRYEYNYFELNNIDITTPSNENQINSFTARLLTPNRRNQIAYFGYPVLLKRIISRGNEYYKIAPVFLYQIDISEGNLGFLDTVPRINPEVLRVFSQESSEQLIFELITLEQELGFSEVDSKIDLTYIDDITALLKSIRPAWVWKESLDSEELNTADPLSALTEPGIYNKAVLMLAERSPYTVGLEFELNALSRLSEEEYRDTALYKWIHPIDKTNNNVGDSQIIEVLPLNTEQEQAVKNAIEADLTIVTGPPGTGKSQVVTDLIINSAWKTMSTLFSSKNNKAVDVVEKRVNELGKRPILLRAGANINANTLENTVSNLLSVSATGADRAAYLEAFQEYETKHAFKKDLEKKKDNIISNRNKLDLAERRIEQYRYETEGLWKQEVFNNLFIYTKATDDLDAALANVRRTNQKSFIRFFWGFYRKKREKIFTEYAKDFNRILRDIRIRELPEQYTDALLSSINAIIISAKERISALSLVNEYLGILAEAKQSETLEQVDAEIFYLKEQLSNCAARMWGKWLITQTDTVSPADRRTMGDLLAAIRLNMGNDGQITSELRRIMNSTINGLKKYLPCWAVTSLSAKGRIPFQAGMYDLLIVDEASQCDIASALPLLFRTKRAVIIGDPMQLNHITQLSKLQDANLLQTYNIEAGWSYSQMSLFDRANGFATNENIIDLRDHHRSHKDIISFSNKEFYENRLRVATKYDRFILPAKTAPGIRWVSCKGTVTTPGSGSLNRDEASLLIEEVRHLVMENDYRGTIGIVTPFRAQADYIRDKISEDTELIARLQGNNDFLVDTVHKFQGDERDVMFFSPVVSEGIGQGSIAFLRNTGNLFNVAITRARSILIVVGNREYCYGCGISYLESFSRYTSELKIRAEDTSEDRTVTYGRQYPHVSNPEQVSEWEKILYSALYADGIKTVPQHPVEQYKLDLALFVSGQRLDIEVDGEMYHRDWTGELCYRDQLRNHRLYELGWDVMRFWVYEVRDDIGWCVEKVKKWVEENE